MSFLLGFFRIYGFMRGIQNITPLRHTFLLSIWFTWLLAVEENNSTNLLLYPANFIIGYLLAMPFVLFVHSASIVCEILDLARGQAFSQILNPLTKIETGETGTLLQSLLLAIVVQYGALPYLFIVLGKSFVLFPTGTFFSQVNLVNLLKISVSILDQAILISIPLALSCLLIELLLMLFGKLQPLPGNYASELITLKFVLLIGCLILALSIFQPAMLRISITNLYRYWS